MKKKKNKKLKKKKVPFKPSNGNVPTILIFKMEVFYFYLKNFISQLVERPTGKKMLNKYLKTIPKPIFYPRTWRVEISLQQEQLYIITYYCTSSKFSRS